MKLFKYLIMTILAVAAVSCSKVDGGKAVNVSVSPSELTASHLLSSQKFEVQADGAWTAKILSEAGESVLWATLSREKGNGNAGIYNLQGVYLGNDASSLAPGLYIVNGQKCIVK